jgi:hypothetical protein
MLEVRAYLEGAGDLTGDEHDAVRLSDRQGVQVVRGAESCAAPQAQGSTSTIKPCPESPPRLEPTRTSTRIFDACVKGE